MSREIKFRAWNRELKKMYDFLPLTIRVNAIEPTYWEPLLEKAQKAFDVMQYTGLKDKNGKEIYDGDIVEEPGSRYEVVYHADGFYMRNMYEPDNILIQLRHGYLHCEVIGNIYENPELLANQSNKKGE